MRPHLGIAILAVSCVLAHADRSALAAEGAVVQASASDQLTILWHYNAERCLVSPPARTMKAIQWDSNLATAASNMARTCQYTSTSVNQGVVLSTDATITFDSALSYVRTTLARDYDYYQSKSKSGLYDLRAYKQMILATQTKVGCALAACPGGIYDTINKRQLNAPDGRLNRSWAVCKYYNEAGTGRPYTQGSYNDQNEACPNVFAGKMKTAGTGFSANPPCVTYKRVEQCSTSGDTFLVTRTADASGSAVYQIYNVNRKMCITAPNLPNVDYGPCTNQVVKFKLENRNSPWMAFRSVVSGLCLYMSPGSYGSSQLMQTKCDAKELRQMFTFIR
jgi:hypothetical protein